MFVSWLTRAATNSAANLAGTAEWGKHSSILWMKFSTSMVSRMLLSWVDELRNFSLSEGLPDSWWGPSAVEAPSDFSVDFSVVSVRFASLDFLA